MRSITAHLGPSEPTSPCLWARTPTRAHGSRPLRSDRCSKVRVLEGASRAAERANKRSSDRASERRAWANAGGALVAHEASREGQVATVVDVHAVEAGGALPGHARARGRAPHEQVAVEVLARVVLAPLPDANLQRR